MSEQHNDTSEEAPNFHQFAAAILEAGIHDGGALRTSADFDRMHVGVTPGEEAEADKLADEFGFELDYAVLTRRVYVPK